MKWNIKICNEDKSHVLKDVVFYGDNYEAKRFLLGLAFDLARYKWFRRCYLDIACSALEHKIEMISPKKTCLLTAECKEVDTEKEVVNKGFLSLEAEAFLSSLESRFDIYDASRFVIEEGDFRSNVSKDLYQIIHINGKENNFTKNHKRTAYRLGDSVKEVADNFASENDISEKDILAIRKCEEDREWPDFVHKFYTEAPLLGLNEKNAEHVFNKIRDFKDGFGWIDVEDRWKEAKEVYAQRRTEFWKHWEI